jgi:hypothetical protein
MRLETVDQRAQRERDIETKRLVLAMAVRHLEQAQQAIDRLSREISELERA